MTSVLTNARASPTLDATEALFWRAFMADGKEKYAGWVITTVAGNGELGYSGDGGPAVEARLNNPFDVVFDPAGNLIFTDTFSHCIRRIDQATGVITTIAGTTEIGYSGDGGPATAARFNEPYGMAVDAGGSLYVADRLNAVVRRIDAETGVATTFAGTGAKGFSGDGGRADQAEMVEPNGLAFSLDYSRLYIADVSDNRVRVVHMAAATISTFAGTGAAAHDGDGGSATAADVFGARAVGVRPSDGSVYVMERQGSCLRLVDAKTGAISTVSSTGETGYGGDDGAATTAIYDRPKEMTIDDEGDVLVVDTENHAIRLIDWASDRVTTIAGTGTSGFNGDGIPASRATLGRPHGVAIGPDGSFYIGDTENHRIRKVSRV
jgi:sugar lactone lactonase YvrE